MINRACDLRKVSCRRVGNSMIIGNVYVGHACHAGGPTKDAP